MTLVVLEARGEDEVPPAGSSHDWEGRVSQVCLQGAPPPVFFWCVLTSSSFYACLSLDIIYNGDAPTLVIAL